MANGVFSPFAPLFIQLTLPAMHWTAGVVQQRLSNGLTAIVQRVSTAPAVAVVTHVRAGYFDEPDEWVGISHVLEHMFFKGTPSRGPGQIARDTQLLGGYLNAATIYDKTVYYTVLPTRNGGLSKAVDIQADALMHATLDPDELGRELEVIVQEANRKLDNPSAVVRETLYELLFAVHRMRRWRIGTEDGLRRLNAAAVRAYYESRYTPDRVIVGIVGNVDESTAMSLVERTYGPWTAPPDVVDVSPAESAPPKSASRVLRGDIARPIATVGWRTVGALDADAPALDVAGLILGSGRGSRLYRTVRIPGLANTAQASHYTPTEVGVLQISLESDSRLDEAIALSMEEVGGLTQSGPSAHELERAHALLAARWARQFESMDGRAMALCEAEALGGYEIADEQFARTQSVTGDDVQRVARDHLDPARACALAYLPGGHSSSLDNGEWPMVPSLASASSVRSVEVGSTGTRSPLRAEETVRYGDGIHHYRFTGADVLVRHKAGSGLVSVGIHFPGVPGREGAENAGISRLLGRCALRGAGSLSAEELAQAAERLGGSIASSTTVDGVGWSITVTPDAAERAAELLRRVALQPSLDPAHVQRERSLQAGDARRLQDDMFRYPVEAVLKRTFQLDPYGLPSMGEPDVLLSIDEGELRAWAEILAEQRAVVVAVGDLAVEELRTRLTPLATWPGTRMWGGEKLATLAPDFGSEARDKVQSALSMTFPAVPAGAPERLAVVVTAALLSGLAGRLFEELREKRSLAYTVAAIPWLRQRAGVMLTYVAMSPEREDEARDALLSEFERLISDRVLERELERARTYAAGLVELRQQSGAAVASEMLGAFVYGTLGELTDESARLRTVTSDDVRGVAELMFGGDHSEYVVRGRSG